MSDTRFHDPSPQQFADSLFADMRAAIAEIDANAERRTAEKAERRRTKAREYRAHAAHKLPAAFESALDSHRFRRVEFDGGFHLEPRDDDYRPGVGDLLRITCMTGTGELTATRQPRRGASERPRPVTAHGAIQLLREFAGSIKENTPLLSLEPPSCECAYVAMPPCYFCETAEFCERCDVPIGWREWPDHLAEHLYDEALARVRASHRRTVRRACLRRSRRAAV